MDDLERQLKDALSRQDAPEWFEARVLAAARQTRPGFWRGWFRSPLPRLATATLAAALVIAGIAVERERAAEERAAGEAAKARLVLALRITRTKLEKIERTLHEVERND